MIIDFTEIPSAGSGKERDDFELFCRDFFSELGYVIEEDPSRGADGGKDLIVIERRNTDLGVKNIRWLVSCKHNAHSGKTVKLNDEVDIPGRVEQHNCQGFISFCSTTRTSGL